MLTKVISGGQNGVDQAALRAAKRVGLLTGGWAPRGYRTLDGPCLELRTQYGLLEHHSDKYPPRTELNVKESDGTLRIARHFGSAGEQCTLKFINKHSKPFMDVDVIDLSPTVMMKVAIWIEAWNIEILNVAGNSEATDPGIGNRACEFLVGVLRYAKNPN
jgi:hypothetical protein